jgi:hypothetical protein
MDSRPGLYDEHMSTNGGSQQGDSSKGFDSHVPRVDEGWYSHIESWQRRKHEKLQDMRAEKQRQESIGNPIENVGAAYGAARNFVSGVVGSDQPAPPQEAAAQFFEVIRSGEQPTPEMVEAAVLYEKENPGVLSAAERQHLRAHVQRLLAETG